VIRKSKIDRLGIFAQEDIPACRKVIEYSGERIDYDEAIRRLLAPGERFYIFSLDRTFTQAIDGAVGGSGAEYINHSCDPNVRAWITKGHILYMSRRAIHCGEELTLDYKFRRQDARAICRCGSPVCRGTVNVK
jgi:SET domain-containing protein